MTSLITEVIKDTMQDNQLLCKTEIPLKVTISIAKNWAKLSKM